MRRLAATLGLLSAAAPAAEFVNPFAEGADPSVVYHGGQYRLCLSDGNRGVAIWSSPDLTRFGARRVIWHAPPTGPCSREIWAPELQFLRGRWYVYVAADDGENRNHRMWVLESAGADPLGAYTNRGMLYTGDDPALRADCRWAIDGAVLEHRGRLYFIWSGWPRTDDVQYLYIAGMSNPWTISTPRVKLCDNADHVWERVGESPAQRGLAEAPQPLVRGGRVFVAYSCSSSWEPTYKLGLLELRPGGDPMNPKDWRKHDRPAFASTESTYGVGHNSFTKSPDGTEDWIVYHAKRDREPGWRRALYAQPFRWKPDGTPDFGVPVRAGASLPLPSGTPLPARRGSYSVTFDGTLPEGWAYFGHQQFIEPRPDGLHLGVRPAEPVNDYRSGEKVVLEGGDWSNLVVTTHVQVVEGGRDAGILYRVRNPAVGFDAHEGYFAGIIPDADRVILGLGDGARWRELARAALSLETGRTYELEVRAEDGRSVVSVDGQSVIDHADDTYRSGSVGLRVVDSHVVFRGLRVD